jgi:hypothetical protein
MTATTGVMTARMIAVTTSVMIAEMTGVMTDIATTTTAKSGLHHHHLKGATPMVCSIQPTERSISLSVVAKRPKAIDRTDQMPGRSDMSTLKPHSLCVGLNSQSLSLGKIIGFTSLAPGPTRWSSIP